MPHSVMDTFTGGLLIERAVPFTPYKFKPVSVCVLPLPNPGEVKKMLPPGIMKAASGPQFTEINDAF